MKENSSNEREFQKWKRILQGMEKETANEDFHFDDLQINSF